MFALAFAFLSGIAIRLPPVIDIGPVTMFLRLYQHLVLRCIATGNPQPTITWYKDGRRITREVSQLLVIQEVELSDRGVYHCTAANTLGTVSSASAVVNIDGMLHSNFRLYSELVYSLNIPIPLAKLGLRQFLCVYTFSGGTLGAESIVDEVRMRL